MFIFYASDRGSLTVMYIFTQDEERTSMEYILVQLLESMTTYWCDALAYLTEALSFTSVNQGKK